MDEHQLRYEKRLRKVCIPGRFADIGGPTSFQRKLTSGFIQRGIEITQDLNDEPYDAILIINGTRHLPRLWHCKRKGVFIVQRLGGINWLHRYLPIGLKGYLLAEIRNLNMRLTRSLIADRIVYQSNFVRDWWNRKYGTLKNSSTIIYNGVDLMRFNPQGPRYESQADVCIISVEGNQGVDPFDIAVQFALGLKGKGLRVELLMFGNPWKDAQSRIAQYPMVRFMGHVPNSELPYFYRGATFFISTDIIAACPNSVIEALACGTPVLGYKVGVLPELIDDSAGGCVECSGDPWKGDPPGNREAMVKAALDLLEKRDRFSQGARSLAEKRYGLDKMVNSYLKVLWE